MVAARVSMFLRACKVHLFDFWLRTQSLLSSQAHLSLG